MRTADRATPRSDTVQSAESGRLCDPAPDSPGGPAATGRGRRRDVDRVGGAPTGETHQRPTPNGEEPCTRLPSMPAGDPENRWGPAFHCRDTVPRLPNGIRRAGRRTSEAPTGIRSPTRLQRADVVAVPLWGPSPLGRAPPRRGAIAGPRQRGLRRPWSMPPSGHIPNLAVSDPLPRHPPSPPAPNRECHRL